MPWSPGQGTAAEKRQWPRNEVAKVRRPPDGSVVRRNDAIGECHAGAGKLFSTSTSQPPETSVPSVPPFWGGRRRAQGLWHLVHLHVFTLPSSTTPDRETERTSVFASFVRIGYALPSGSHLRQPAQGTLWRWITPIITGNGRMEILVNKMKGHPSSSARPPIALITVWLQAGWWVLDRKKGPPEHTTPFLWPGLASVHWIGWPRCVNERTGAFH